MRTMRMGVRAVALVLAAAAPLWAAETNTVYNSGILIVAFVGLCALVVVAQFVPVVMLLAGLIKGIAGLLTRGRMTEQRETQR